MALTHNVLILLLIGVFYRAVLTRFPPGRGALAAGGLVLIATAITDRVVPCAVRELDGWNKRTCPAFSLLPDSIKIHPDGLMVAALLETALLCSWMSPICKYWTLCIENKRREKIR